MDKNAQGSVVVKNVSKGSTSLAAPGNPKILIAAGESHTFADQKAYNIYLKSAQAMKSLGIVEISMGGKVDKVIPTPAMDAQADKLAEAAAKSQMAPPAPEAPAADDAAGDKEEDKGEDKADKKPAAKGIAANKKK